MALTGRDALVELSSQYEGCKRCGLHEHRTQVVFGSGSASACVIIIGEAPGEDEDEEGETFIGPSGRLLMDMIANAWPRTDQLEEIRAIEEDDEYFGALRDYLDNYVFWTNVVPCRPLDNRTPGTKEINACKDRLYRTIYAIDPDLVIAAGKPAASALVGKVIPILAKHGKLFDISIPSPETGNPIRYPMLALLHPAYLLRKGDQALVSRKEGNTYDTIEDLKYGFYLLQSALERVLDTSFPDREATR